MWLYKHWPIWSDFTAHPALSRRLDWRPLEVPSSLNFSMILWSTKCNERSTKIYIRVLACTMGIAHVQCPSANTICKPELPLQVCLEHIISLSLAQSRETMGIFSQHCGWRRDNSACILCSSLGVGRLAWGIHSELHCFHHSLSRFKATFPRSMP